MNETRILVGNKVRVTKVYDIPRYETSICSDEFEAEQMLADIKEECKFCVMVDDYRSLTNVDLDEDNIFTKTSLQVDLKRYQKFLDDEYGKGEYEAFVLGAYIHSGISFSISKEGDHRCRFDSGQLGFIGLPTDTKVVYNAECPNKVARCLTAIYNGEFRQYEIIDNLTLDAIDSICDFDYNTIKQWQKAASEKYGVTFDE